MLAKLLPWGAGIAVVLALLAYSGSAEAAAPQDSAVAPAAVIVALGKASYEEGASGSGPSGAGVHTIFAQAVDLLADPYTAKSWVRAEQTTGRVVFCTTSVLEELELSSAPLYSFAPDKIPSYVAKSTTFYRLPTI
jgi:hypothetical protein